MKPDEMNPELTAQQLRMNAAFRQIIDPLLDHAERDVRLARADGDRAATAKAQARLETLKAARGIYAAAHRQGYGEMPWPTDAQTGQPT